LQVSVRTPVFRRRKLAPTLPERDAGAALSTFTGSRNCGGRRSSAARLATAAAGNHTVADGDGSADSVPGVEHAEEARVTPRRSGSAAIVSKVWRDAEENLVDDRFVVEGDVGDGFGQGEDHVKVSVGNNSAFLWSSHWFAPALALGTMRPRGYPAAGAIAGMGILAVVAPFDRTAQRRVRQASMACMSGADAGARRGPAGKPGRIVERCRPIQGWLGH